MTKFTTIGLVGALALALASGCGADEGSDAGDVSGSNQGPTQGKGDVIGEGGEVSCSYELGGALSGVERGHASRQRLAYKAIVTYMYEVLGDESLIGRRVAQTLAAVDEQRVEIAALEVDGASYEWVSFTIEGVEGGALFVPGVDSVMPALVTEGRVVACEQTSRGSICRPDAEAWEVSTTKDLGALAMPAHAFELRGADEASSAPVAEALATVAATLPASDLAEGEIDVPLRAPTLFTT